MGSEFYTQGSDNLRLNLPPNNSVARHFGISYCGADATYWFMLVIDEGPPAKHIPLSVLRHIKVDDSHTIVEVSMKARLDDPELVDMRESNRALGLFHSHFGMAGAEENDHCFWFTLVVETRSGRIPLSLLRTVHLDSMYAIVELTTNEMGITTPVAEVDQRLVCEWCTEQVGCTFAFAEDMESWVCIGCLVSLTKENTNAAGKEPAGKKPAGKKPACKKTLGPYKKPAAVKPTPKVKAQMTYKKPAAVKSTQKVKAQATAAAVAKKPAGKKPWTKSAPMTASTRAEKFNLNCSLCSFWTPARKLHFKMGRGSYMEKMCIVCYYGLNSPEAITDAAERFFAQIAGPPSDYFSPQDIADMLAA